MFVEQALWDVEVARSWLLLLLPLGLGLWAVHALPFRPCISLLMLPLVAIGDLRMSAPFTRGIFEILRHPLLLLKREPREWSRDKTFERAEDG